jgi:hypothetical protein
MMTRVVAGMAVVIAIAGPAAAGQGVAACRQPVATVTAPERSYANIAVPEFSGRVFVYAPEIRATPPAAFAPFQVWLIEGVYGRPFVELRGPLDDAAFERIRRSGNIRATPVGVSRSGDAGRVTLARRAMTVQVTVAVAPRGADQVTVRVCRAQ